MVKSIFLFLCAFMFISCTSLEEHKLNDLDANSSVAFLTKEDSIKLPYGRFSENFVYKQLLTISYGANSNSLIVLLNVKDNVIKLDALSVLGIKLFSASFDGHNINVKNYLNIKELPKASQVLCDILLSFYKVEDWYDTLEDKFILKDNGNMRLLSKNNQVIEEIYYDNMNNKRLPIKISHKEFNYSISIEYLD